MSSYNVVLQYSEADGVGVRPGSCTLFAVSGLPRPVRLTFLAADPSAAAAAGAAYDAADFLLKAASGGAGAVCNGPVTPPMDALSNCRTWTEPYTEQILIPVLGQPCTQSAASFLQKWQSRAAHLSRILPALLAGLRPDQAFPTGPMSLSHLQHAAWGGQPNVLAKIALEATMGDRPSVFLSYIRKEARDAADQLFDALGHRGYRVYLDRFSGAPGRIFPEQIAEELADKAVLLLLHTSGLPGSYWTRWEISFARRYHLGIIVLELENLRPLRRVSARLQISPGMDGKLSAHDLARAIDFIGAEHWRASLKRRAFYEGLIGSAAGSKSGSVRSLRSGLFELHGSSGTKVADILPAGRPAQLSDVRLLSQGSTVSKRLLLSQHQHLPSGARMNVQWLATQFKVDLVGPWVIFKTVQNLC